MDTAKALGQQYRPRVIDGPLHRALQSAGAVVLEGARATGKTMTGLNAAASYIFIDDPEARQLMDIAPRSVLDGSSPRLLDEWQVAPDLWNLVRRSVDASAEPGRFILTGSAVPTDDATRHTGAGRFLRIHLRTMSWWEKLPSPLASVSLAQLFDGSHPATNLGVASTLADTIERLLVPGFPGLSRLEPTQSADRLRSYIDDVARIDIQRIADVRHNPAVIKQLISAVARSVASPVSYRTLAADLRTVAPTIDVETISAYVNLLQRLFIIEAQPPWTPRLRSRARIRTSPKLHLVDPALAAAALGAGPDRLASDLATLGVLFESAAVHDLTVLTSAIGGEVAHYRDSNGHEIDAVLTLPDGRWAAVEVKLGGAQIATGVGSLREALAQVDADTPPAFRLVITGTGPILATEDGTITAPLHALAP